MWENVCYLWNVKSVIQDMLLKNVVWICLGRIIELSQFKDYRVVIVLHSLFPYLYLIIHRGTSQKTASIVL